MIINELRHCPTRSDNVYFANNKQAWLAVFTVMFCFTHAEHNLIKRKLLPPIRAAEIVECVHKYMNRSSQNLQSFSSYYKDPPTVFLLIWITVKQVKSLTQTS